MEIYGTWESVRAGLQDGAACQQEYRGPVATAAVAAAAAFAAAAAAVLGSASRPADSLIATCCSAAPLALCLPLQLPVLRCSEAQGKMYAIRLAMGQPAVCICHPGFLHLLAPRLRWEAPPAKHLPSNRCRCRNILFTLCRRLCRTRPAIPLLALQLRMHMRSEIIQPKGTVS